MAEHGPEGLDHRDEREHLIVERVPPEREGSSVAWSLDWQTPWPAVFIWNPGVFTVLFELDFHAMRQPAKFGGERGNSVC